jgi:predicted component of type VI protein secretion system
MEGELAGVSKRHCSLQFQGDNVILTDHSTSGTFVDEVRVTKTVVLKLGQIIRMGTPGEELQLIACVGRNET